MLKKVMQTQKTINKFLDQVFKNYRSMKDKIKKIWLPIAIIAICTINQSCNVSRVITNESQYFQKGDTAVVIQTKTIETYNAEKK